MFVAICFYFLIILGTLLAPKTKEAALEFPDSEVVHQERRIPFLDNFTPWLIIMIIVILLAYIPAFLDVYNLTGPGAPPYSPENPIPLELSK
jgi:cytochrome c oxidase subunit 1